MAQNLIQTIKPGVVTGADYERLVEACKQGGFALPAVNVISSETASAAMEAAARAGSPIIIQVSHGGARFYAGQGLKDDLQAKIKGAVALAQHVHLLAKDYGIPVVLHTDHASKELLPWIEGLMEYNEQAFAQTGSPLFTSHMLDLSEETLEDNIAISSRMLERMSKIGMSLEIELGVTGGEEDGVDNSHVDTSRLYTQPSEVLKAYEALSPLGHFTVAAAFGNVHGVYSPGNVVLKPSILKDSQDMIQCTYRGERNPLNFVFHGGSGSEPAKIAEAITYGVFKMNIDTDLQFAFSEVVGEYVKKNSRAFQYQVDPFEKDSKGKEIVYKNKYDPRKWLREGQKGFMDRLDQAFTDLGSKGCYAAPAADM
ncbi:MAG: class II fructose-bisphosphate aldolase [Alphaproteobacteria bacterium]|nr:class II fructose-bisphosphate aldolase [Alphaproteobacteria bacterium]MCD8525971.1 class II fructose-bisphosphate aldolase [Alphaproteobacteria bacterium]MCD8570908.1 class II fructose-bisphosphate aldolase [Alphaproteobacteria bacterium]